MSRLKSTSKGGQSLKARANESKGKRKAELNKISKTDKANYAKAPKSVQAEIKAKYRKGTGKAKEQNKGTYI